MTHRFRFFSPACSSSASDGAEQIVLRDEEVKHLKIVRLQVGGEFEVFDGQGVVYACVLHSISKTTALCEIKSKTYTPAPQTKVVAALAIQQPNVFSEVLRSLVELGVDRFALFRHQRDALFKLRRQEHWQKIILNACKQAKRAWLPDVTLLHTWQALLDYVRNYDCVVLDKSGEHGLLALKPQGDVCFVVGASCGYDAAELASLQSLPTARVVSLGNNTLRATTAAIYVGGVLCERRGR
ncbi:MAG: RsmE family RNA methyltransferase [Pseudomonadota bacterium]|nr:RsmE family RNA methyltransferase [Pseudomonadota bacterium]